MAERKEQAFKDRPSPLALLWSGGKDALLALLALEARGAEVAALVTTVAGAEERVTMHGVALPLVEAQARALDLPLAVMRQPRVRVPNEEYERLLGQALAPLKEQGVGRVAAGDLFLEDVRDYRAAVLRRLGFQPIFPLWEADTAALARRFVREGHRATVCSADTEQLDASFAGRAYDDALLADLPASVDPCGERGAFHTFVWGGPRFAEDVPVEVGAVRQEGQMAVAALRLGHALQ